MEVEKLSEEVDLTVGASPQEAGDTAHTGVPVEQPSTHRVEDLRDVVKPARYNNGRGFRARKMEAEAEAARELADTISYYRHVTVEMAAALRGMQDEIIEQALHYQTVVETQMRWRTRAFIGFMAIAGAIVLHLTGLSS